MDCREIIDEIRAALWDVRFPMAKWRLIVEAQYRGASFETVRALEKVPDVVYDHLGEVINALPLAKIEGEFVRFV